MPAADSANHVYEYQPSFILGFHGCDASVGEKILQSGKEHLRFSEKAYDWLGHGIYFWEGSVARAMEWAQERKAMGIIEQPFVLGAIIDLRHCLDLFDRAAASQVRFAYDSLVQMTASVGGKLPVNVGPTPDKAGRALDCAVMNLLHSLREVGGLERYDSVRGPFLEGERIYEGAGFRTHTHIQIAVRDQRCIKGYFRPIEAGG